MPTFRGAACAACFGVLLTSQAVGQNLNTTGKDVSLFVPLREAGRIVGEVTLQISATDDLALSADELTLALKDRLTETAAADLRAAADENGLLGQPALAALGYELSFDPGELSASISPPGANRAVETLSVLPRTQWFDRPLTGRKPDALSAYVNLTGNLTRGDEGDLSDIADSASLGFDGAVAIPTLNHLVFEASGGLSKADGFELGSARAVYDDMPRDLRWRAGTVSSRTLNLGGENVLGVQFEPRESSRSQSDLARAQDSATFTLDRRSIVRIRINETLTREYELDPGNYDIRDFPNVDGLSTTRVEVEDENGVREILSFNSFFDRRLRPVGTHDYGLTVGLLEQDRDELRYKDPMLAGFYERGVDERLTLAGSFKASPHRAVAGAEATTPLLGGLLRADAEVSASNDDTGYSAGVSWGRSIFEDARAPISISGSVRGTSKAYTSSLYDIDPQQSHGLDLSLGASTRFESWNFSIRGRALLAPYGAETERYNATASLGRSFGPYDIRMGVGYDNDGADEEFTASLRLNWRIDDRQDFSTDYDYPENTVTASYSRRSEETGVGSWALYASGETDLDDGSVTASGSAYYAGNRGTVRLNHSENILNADGGGAGRRTRLSVESAIVYADGKLAVGRRVSDSFVIVDGHSSLGDAQIYAGGDVNNYQAHSGPLGGAVVSQLGSYRDNPVAYDAPDAPIGYDLGAASEILAPTYRSGYALRVGSAYSVTAIGVLIDRYGEPLALKVGAARAVNDPDAPEVELFTNRAGRFGAQGLAPGEWRIEMPGDPAESYRLVIPEGAEGLVRAGELTPEDAQ